ncbi:hypothetical protein Trydic_g17278 [Trypoxylus dichotomus]
MAAKLVILKVTDLKRELEERSQDTSGRKAEFQQGLKNALEVASEDPENCLFEVGSEAGNLGEMLGGMKEEFMECSRSLKEELWKIPETRRRNLWCILDTWNKNSKNILEL